MNTNNRDNQFTRRPVMLPRKFAPAAVTNAVKSVEVSAQITPTSRLHKMRQMKMLTSINSILITIRSSKLRAMSLALVVVILSSLIIQIFPLNKKAEAAILSAGPNSASATGDCVNDSNGGTMGTVAWTSPGNAFSSNDTRATASVDGTTTNYIKCTNFGFSIPTGAEIVGIVVGVERSSNSTGNGGSNDAAMRIVKGGTIGTTDKSTATAWPTTEAYEDHGSSSELWGQSWAVSDINATNFGAAIAATKASAAGAAHTVSVDHMRITVYYSVNSKIDVNGYIWENDDGVDNGSQQAAGNTAISGVRKGERLSLRTQIKNTGTDSLNSNLALFYDQNDGNFVKVNTPTSKTETGSGCAVSTWTCSSIDGSNATGGYLSTAISKNGTEYISYYDFSTNDLRVAQYVGTGGTGCATTAWTCTTIDSTNDTGYYTSIAFNASGIPYISYIYGTSGDLRVAQYVGTGGTGCATTAWTCTTIHSSINVGQTTSLAFNANDNPYVSYIDTTNADLLIAQYVGTGGTGCATTAWTCTTVENTTDGVDGATSLAFNANDVAYISYAESGTAQNLRVAQYVGTGGTGCTNTAWTCTTVDSTNSVGDNSSIAFSPNGTPYISYIYETNNDLRVAQYVGTGGTGCATTAWTCTTVDSTADVINQTSIAFSPDGAPYISYENNTGVNLQLAQYVGAGGTGCATTAWTCTVIDSTNANGAYSSIVFTPNGSPAIVYFDNTDNDVRIARLARSGAINFSASTNTGSVTNSHADMTTVSDSSNKTDADCIGGGTWQNGVVASAPEIRSLGLSAGNCTEVVFTIDTSQATAGTTYRFVIASADNWRQDKGKWRGPVAVASGAYPTLTIENDTETISIRGSKDVEPQGGSCALAAWTCTGVDTTNSVGQYTSLAFGSTGKPFISYYDNSTQDLRVAQYVGTGGTGCASSAWTCTAVDTTNSVGQYSSIAISASGVPYVSYKDVTTLDLRVAQYVGSGGTGCASSAWTCTSVDTTNDVGEYTSIAINSNGVPYVGYGDVTNGDLRVAQYVGSGGTGCASSAWTCTAVDTTNSVGAYVSMAFSPSGVPYVSYQEYTNFDLRVAQYVGSGGTGCASSAWTCTSVDTASNVYSTSIAFSPTGVPYVGYLNNSSTDLHVAQYVGSGGTGCATTAWTCTSVDTANDVGNHTSIAFSPSGVPFVSYYDATFGISGLRVAQYVGSGGTGCATTAWTCAEVDSTDDTGYHTSIAFSPTGVPYISYADITNGNLRVAKLSTSSEKLFSSTSYVNPGNRNGTWSEGRFHLADGRSPRTNALGRCSGVMATMMGYCGLYNDDGNTDSITAQISERPLYNFSYKVSSNAELPTVSWIGRSSLAPSTGGTTGDIKLQVYRFGTTNAWVDVVADSASTNCNTENCKLMGIPGGTASEYFEADGSAYRMNVRVWQYESGSQTIDFKTDLIQLQYITKQIRHGQQFQNNVKRPFSF